MHSEHKIHNMKSKYKLVQDRTKLTESAAFQENYV